jgi:hypothetical protein
MRVRTQFTDIDTDTDPDLRNKFGAFNNMYRLDKLTGHY